MNVQKLDEAEKRSAVIRCYVTREEKLDAAQLAADVGLSSSDLVRILLADATREEALRLTLRYPDLVRS